MEDTRVTEVQIAARQECQECQETVMFIIWMLLKMLIH